MALPCSFYLFSDLLPWFRTRLVEEEATGCVPGFPLSSLPLSLPPLVLASPHPRSAILGSKDPDGSLTSREQPLCGQREGLCVCFFSSVPSPLLLFVLCSLSRMLRSGRGKPAVLGASGWRSSQSWRESPDLVQKGLSSRPLWPLPATWGPGFLVGRRREADWGCPRPLLASAVGDSPVTRLQNIITNFYCS